MNARYDVGQSNDWMGALWRDPHQFTRVVPVREYPKVRTAEVVGVGGIRRVARMIEGLREQDIRPVQIHSNPGVVGVNVPDSLKLGVISRFILSPRVVELVFPDMDSVVHATAADSAWNIRHTPRVLIENIEVGEAGFDNARLWVDALRKQHVPARLLVDLVHYVRGIPVGKTFDARWTRLTREIGDLSASPNGNLYEIHVPIGADHKDSLPEAMTNSHRRDLLQAIGPSVRRITFENQRGGPFGLLGLWGRGESKERDRLSRMYAMWGKAGLFDRAR